MGDGRQDLDRLCEIVWTDETLQAPLRAIIDERELIAMAVRLGQEHGLRFDAEDVVARMRHNGTILMLMGGFA